MKKRYPAARLSKASSVPLISQNFAERSVFNYIVSRFEVSARELVHHTGMPGSTVAGIVNRLAARGLLAPTGTEIGQRGRPSIRYQLRIPRPICACELDATQVSVAVLDRDLRPRALQVQTFGRIKSLEAATGVINEALAQLRSSLPRSVERPSELALALNAIPLKQNQVVSSVLPWAGLDLEAPLAKKLGLRVKIVPPVVSLIAEKQKLYRPVPESFVRLQVGDGVSAHVAIGGETYQGHTYLAGELGHVTVDSNGPLCGCGRRGCLEAYCGGPALHEQLLQDLASGVSTTIEHSKVVQASPRVSLGVVYEAWKKGDTYAQDFMRRVLERLASALGIVMNLFDPELIVTAGYVLADRPEWVEEIRRYAQQWTLHSPLRPIPIRQGQATLEDRLRVIGTLHFFRFKEKKANWVD